MEHPTVAMEHPTVAGEIPALREMIGVPPAEVPAVDWNAVHSGLGPVLPSDYREFMDAYGPGTFGVIRSSMSTICTGC